MLGGVFYKILTLNIEDTIIADLKAGVVLTAMVYAGDKFLGRNREGYRGRSTPHIFSGFVAGSALFRGAENLMDFIN